MSRPTIMADAIQVDASVAAGLLTADPTPRETCELQINWVPLPARTRWPAPASLLGPRPRPMQKRPSEYTRAETAHMIVAWSGV
jgi:hypothetical protein